MKIWKQHFEVEQMNRFNANSLAETLEITVVEIGDDFIKATMPVNHKTVQPFRILHGGASVVLAESLGSVASTLCIENLQTHTAVGVEINANHLKSVKEGKMVTGICRPVRVGRNIHVWNIEVRDENGDLSCISRLTVAIVEKR